MYRASARLTAQLFLIEECGRKTVFGKRGRLKVQAETKLKNAQVTWFTWQQVTTIFDPDCCTVVDD